MLAVDNANKGEKDEKDDDDADNNEDEHSLLSTTVDGAKYDVRRVESGSCRRRRCLLTDSVKILFLVNSSLNMNVSQLSCGAVDSINL